MRILETQDLDKMREDKQYRPVVESVSGMRWKVRLDRKGVVRLTRTEEPVTLPLQATTVEGGGA